MIHIKERLMQYADKYSGCYKYAGVYVKVIQDMIEQLLADLEEDEKENGWIPVSERLPEDEKECLVTLEKVYGTPEKLYGIANYLKFGDAGYWNEKKYGYLEWDKYSDGHGGTRMYKVIAWMPLPEPYKEDEP
jgi:hypothetical protein